ncbi:adenosylmethionine decarboxylase [Chitiniphilus purpureus]|uniref:Adenosylmethionine decarboxylase n=1 Tax=Chitiniphilus purpureus TaxID=2981137 RepID=A0ABY6DLV2_9NEIS|nr:adenosylmethionine decarboxylase [Chitiniphilus sp. CD1]UXY15183.1 adenosylmethionine decarboxylase [Chitiniphilus sp. CD1]
MNDTGYHYIIDMKVRNGKLLNCPSELQQIFDEALIGFTILKYDFFQFSGGGEGVTGFFLLSESHCSYHTYPENNYIAIDIFTCGRDPGDIASRLAEALGAVCYSSRYIARGSSQTAPIEYHPKTEAALA